MDLENHKELFRKIIAVRFIEEVLDQDAIKSLRDIYEHGSSDMAFVRDFQNDFCHPPKLTLSGQFRLFTEEILRVNEIIHFARTYYNTLYLFDAKQKIQRHRSWVFWPNIPTAFKPGNNL